MDEFVWHALVYEKYIKWGSIAHLSHLASLKHLKAIILPNPKYEELLCTPYMQIRINVQINIVKVFRSILHDHELSLNLPLPFFPAK
jgi:hypothetical protein